MTKVLSILLAVIALAGTARGEVVSRDAIETYLSEVLPEHLEPGEFEYRVFEQGGSGRVSVAGNLRFAQTMVAHFPDMYALWPRLVREADPQNTSDDAAILEAAKWLRLPYSNVYSSQIKMFTTVYNIGASVPFTAELPYLETVGGVRLSGSPESVALNPAVRMQTEDSLGADQIMIGSDRFNDFVLEIAENARREEDLVAEARARAIAWMESGKITFSHERLRGQATPVFTVDGGFENLEGLEQAHWSDAGNRSSVLDFAGTAVFPQDWKSANPPIDAKAGEQYPVRMQLAVVDEEREKGRTTIRVSMLVRERWRDKFAYVEYYDGVFSSYSDWSVSFSE